MDPFIILFIGIVVVVGGILWLRLHAFLALLAAAIVVGVLTPASAVERFARDKKMSESAAKNLARQSVGERVAQEFGSTCGKIGILIAMASIVGKCLLDSGAADRIVRSALRLVGEARAALAFLGSGFLLGIPVFFDTVFYLMIPLGKALRMRTGRNYLLYVLTIAAGATMTHSLAPPTPGPLFVASALNVDIGLMILGGCTVGLFTVIYGYLHATVANRIWEIPLRDTADVSLSELENLAVRDESELPPLWLALLPIVLPVILIGGKTVLDSLVDRAAMPSGAGATLMTVADLVGNQNIALTLSAAIGLATLLKQKRATRESLAGVVESAVASGGSIILITSAGGAFGGMLQQTGIGLRIEEMARAYQIAALPLAFCVTTLIRTAQGSATVAMITAVGILAGVADAQQLGFHPLYIALAIGCGSKPIAWMNDSGFWVISKMSGMTPGETLKTLTPMTAMMGLVGLVVTMIGAALFPNFGGT